MFVLLFCCRLLLLSCFSSHYALEIRPDLGACTFSARVSISVTISAATSVIQLNAVELQVSKAEIVLEAAGGASSSAASAAAAATAVPAAIEHDEKAELLTLTFPSELVVGRATLTLTYTGLLNDDMRGFYCSKYKDAAGVEQRIATTQFEATSVTARWGTLRCLLPAAACTMLGSSLCSIASVLSFVLHLQGLSSCHALLG